MNVLIACEESQRTCSEFRRLGYNAFSCDLKSCSGGHPEYHIRGDCFSVLKENVSFVTEIGKTITLPGWDLLIAHPPCTYLSKAGNRWFNIERYGDSALDRLKERELAAKFFLEFTRVNIPFVAIENPVGYMTSRYRIPDQIVEPYYFGDPDSKMTCFWLKGLPRLFVEHCVDPDYVVTSSGRKYPLWHYNSRNLNGEQRREFRSKTFPGLAAAMARQWGGFVESYNLFWYGCDSYYPEDK